MCKVFAVLLAVTLFALPAHAISIAPTLDLEKKIAYQQGQFGALYAHCGSHDDQAAVIGGSLTTWRMETFEGYHGTVAERDALQKEFDAAAQAVVADNSSCTNWLQQAGSGLGAIGRAVLCLRRGR